MACLLEEAAFQRQRADVNLKCSEYWTPSRKAGVLYVTFAAFDAFFKAGGSPKVGLEIQPKTIADSTQVLMLQEYSEYIESWLDSGKIVDCDRAPEASSKKALVAHLDAFIQPMLPDGERVDKAQRDAALDAVCATGILHGRTERMKRISTGRYITIDV